MATSVTIGAPCSGKTNRYNEDNQTTYPSHKAEDPASTATLPGKGHQKAETRPKASAKKAIINGITEGLSITKIQGIKDIGYLVNGIAKSLIQTVTYPIG